jgi:mono/diheme cytochrome c family protein
MDTIKNKVAVALLLMVGLAATAFAQNGAVGKDLFASRCAICHDADGSGKTAVGKKLKLSNLGSPEVQKRSDEYFTTMISKGAGKMPAWYDRLTPQQIDQIRDYIRELGKQESEAKAQKKE